jgi:hypothetical protein
MEEMKMEAVCSSETSVNFYRSIRLCIPGHSTLHSDRCENFKYNETQCVYCEVGIEFLNIIYVKSVALRVSVAYV